MPCRLSIALMLILVHPVQAEVYRSVDGEGNVIFSDTPREGSEAIKLKETTVVPALKPKTRFSTPPPGAGNVAVPYESIDIASPRNEETFRDAQQVSVSVALSPGLQTRFGHEVQLYVDGAPFGNPGSETQFVLEEVERGSHELQATVLDRSGRELKRSPSSVFFFHKHSVRSPARAP